jgi:hypothetical protein
MTAGGRQRRVAEIAMDDAQAAAGSVEKDTLTASIACHLPRFVAGRVS